MRQLVIVLKRQQPFRLFFLVLTTLSGVGFLTSPTTGALPPYVTHGWAWCLALTGLLGMVGIAWQRWSIMRGILFVRGALMLQSGAVVAYAGFLVGYRVPQWQLSTVAAAVWVWACLAEARLLRKDIGLIEGAASDES